MNKIEAGDGRFKNKTVELKLLESGGTPGPVVMGGDSCLKGRGYKSRMPYTGWTFFTLICCTNCIVFFEKTENEQQRGRGWPVF